MILLEGLGSFQEILTLEFSLIFWLSSCYNNCYYKQRNLDKIPFDRYLNIHHYLDPNVTAWLLI